MGRPGSPFPRSVKGIPRGAFARVRLPNGHPKYAQRTPTGFPGSTQRTHKDVQRTPNGHPADAQRTLTGHPIDAQRTLKGHPTDTLDTQGTPDGYPTAISTNTLAAAKPSSCPVWQARMFLAKSTCSLPVVVVAVAGNIDSRLPRVAHAVMCMVQLNMLVAAQSFRCRVSILAHRGRHLRLGQV